MKAVLTVLALIAGLAAVLPHAAAVEPDEILQDPALEARARAISKELRCLVCQNQSIDDSNAGLARDLRILVRERLQAGDDDDAVIAFVTARYGDYVLLRPPFRETTWALWLGPAALLLLAALGVFVYFRRRARAAPPTSLTAEERARLDALLRDGES